MIAEVKIEKFEAIPDAKLYGNLGQVGHSLRNAVSELVDNSIDARIPGQKLSIGITFDEVNQVIRINDNGKGMSKEAARDSLVLGKSIKTKKLGFFGLGLKTAGLSLGNIITIKTKKENSDECYEVEFDRVDFEKRDDWSMLIKTLPVDIEGRGTTIIISDLLVRLSYQKADRLKEYFANRYRSFIQSEDIEIFVNGLKCEPATPEYIMEEPISLTTIRGDKINGVLRLQTKRLQKKVEYGFDLYYNKRIITSLDKIGFDGNHGEKALICGELHLDFCKVNFTKNSFLKQTEQYRAAEKAVREYLRPLFPLFTTKNVTKEKIQGLLRIQQKTGKVPNLYEFKKMITQLDDGDIETEEVVYDNKQEVELTSVQEPVGLPKSAELMNQIVAHNEILAMISKSIEEKEIVNEISNNSITEMQLSGYAEALHNVANQIELVVQRAKSVNKETVGAVSY